jgi:hypothetical protein
MGGEKAEKPDNESHLDHAKYQEKKRIKPCTSSRYKRETINFIGRRGGFSYSREGGRDGRREERKRDRIRTIKRTKPATGDITSENEGEYMTDTHETERLARIDA